MYPGKGKFEYDLLRHSAYETVIEASKKFKKRDQTEARFRFER